MKSILPELSRSYKSRPYISELKSKKNHHRKRKRPSCCCFEIRPCPEKNGIGMFATQEIACGSLIIAQEDPIIGATVVGGDQTTAIIKHFCNHCRTPLGSLREDHLQAPDNVELPCLGVGVSSSNINNNNKGLIFTTTNNDSRVCCQECSQGGAVAWCSETCALQGQGQHVFLCPGGKSEPSPRRRALDEFYAWVVQEQGTPSIIFQLAVNAITLILSTVVKNNSSNNKESIDDEQQLYWWRDYGSHPLWWNIVVGSSNNKGDPQQQQQQRRKQTHKFCQLLQAVLLESIQSLFFDAKTEQPQKALTTIVNKVCTLETMGEILGMLQCNVMEFEYLSPVQQYMEHVEHYYLQEDEDNDPKHSEGIDWLAKHVYMPGGENDDDDEVSSMNHHQQHHNQKVVASASPMIGSGLYPLLTLANHDCDPNASIDFLQESNRGSMVALRDIAAGEEICITYVPNGDWDSSSGNPNRFQHLEPTRTWKWLNHQNDNGAVVDASTDDDDDESIENIDNSNDSDAPEDSSHAMMGDDDDDENNEDSVESASSNEDDREELIIAEGSNQSDRARALLEYGFECQCARCQHEKANPDTGTPYSREH